MAVIEGQDTFPDISIVTPSFNQGAYIEKTIRSVIDQDYEHLDYVIMDGASTDGTCDILKIFQWHPRVRHIVSEPDRGQTDALIKGFALSRGEILGWLNSDDLLEPGALKVVARTFLMFPDADVVVGMLRFNDPDGREIRVAPRKEMTVNDWRTTTMAIGQQCTFFRASVFQRLGGLNPSIHHVMDYDLFMRMAVAGYKFVYIPDLLASFRFHPDSKTIGTPWKLWREEFKVFRRHGGRLFSSFYYWKLREIVAFFIRQKLLRRRRY